MKSPPRIARSYPAHLPEYISFRRTTDPGLESESDPDDFADSFYREEELEEEEDEDEDEEGDDDDTDDTDDSDDSDDYDEFESEYDTDDLFDDIPRSRFTTPAPGIMPDEHMASGGELHTPQRSAILGIHRMMRPESTPVPGIVGNGSEDEEPTTPGRSAILAAILVPFNHELGRARLKDDDELLDFCEDVLQIPRFTAMEVLHSKRARRWDSEEEYQESLRETLRKIMDSGDRETGSVVVDHSQLNRFVEFVVDDGRYFEEGCRNTLCVNGWKGRERYNKVWMDRWKHTMFAAGTGSDGDNGGQSEDDEEEEEEEDEDTAHEDEDENSNEERESGLSENHSTTSTPSSRKRQATSLEDTQSEERPDKIRRTSADGRRHNAIS